MRELRLPLSFYLQCAMLSLRGRHEPDEPMWKQSMAAAALIASLSAAAQAQGRPDTRAMSCGEVRSLLVTRGAAVLTTGPHTYDRYVVDSRFCAHPQVAVRATVATSDVRLCVVYRCENRDPDERLWRW